MTAGLLPGPVRASRGVVLVPDTDLDSALARDYDMVVLPGGGPGAEHLSQDGRVGDLLRRMADSGRFVAAVCAAPQVLAGAGLLAGRRATAYPGVLEALDLADTTLEQRPVVRDGHVITSRGPGTAMDFTLELVEILAGADTRREVEDKLVRPG